MTRRVNRAKKRQPQKRPLRWRLRRMGPWVPLAVIVVGVVAVFLVVILAGGVLRGDSQVDIPPRTVSTQGRTLGPENARVTIEEYSDFQCPFCARVAERVLPEIESQYVADGRVRFVYRPLAFLGQESLWSAEAAECANEQERFWDYHDKLFENQEGENRGAFAMDNLKRFAQELGLDTQAFNQCLDSHQYEDALKKDTRDALDQGITTTPIFVIGEQTVRGAQDFEEFQSVIEAELRKNP